MQVVPVAGPHIRGKAGQKDIEKRFKDPDDPLELVIVRDMWLTGFDAPCAHTLYLDKPMKGHGLMQAISRVNRVFRDKPSGLVVDYLGLADQLRRAVGVYGGGRGERPGIPIDEALEALRRHFEVAKALFHGFDYEGYFTTRAAARVAALSGGADHVLGLKDGKKRFLDAMAGLQKAAGIAIHLEGARALRDEVGYFQAVRAGIVKATGAGGGGGRSGEEVEAAIRQLVSGAISSRGVIDIFGAEGMERPDLSILSDAFLETVRQSPYRNLQLEVLRRLLGDEIKAMTRRNVVQARKFSEMLAETVRGYQNRAMESAEAIQELIAMARKIREERERGKRLGLTEDEIAFYDALIDHGGVREVMGDDVLRVIAQDLVESIRRSVSIDWTRKEAVRAKMRSMVRRLLRKHGYPPDKAEAAVVTVIAQAEQVCREWSGEA